jgi:hypothetical protein
MMTKLFSQRSNVSQLTFLFVMSLMIFLTGCHKDSLFSTQLSKEEEVFNSKQGDLVASQKYVIKIDDAKEWFETQINFNTSMNLANDSLLILPNASPIWGGALNDHNQLGKEFVVAPLKKRISGGPGDTRLLITRDSANNLVGVFMIYVADKDYHNATNGQYRLSDFRGDIIYLDINGRFLCGYKIQNGQIIGSVTARQKDGERSNSIQPRTCTTQTASYCIYEIYEYINQVGIASMSSNCLVEFQMTSTTCPPTSSSSNIPTSPIGSGSSGSGGLFGLPSSTFTISQLNALRIKYRDNGLEDIWLGYLNNNSTLLQATESFLNARGGFTSANKAALLRLIPQATNVASLVKYLELLVSNNDFFNANVATNFPSSAVVALERYTNAGFSSAEFVQIFSDQTLFQQIDPFLNKYAVNGVFNSKDIEIAKAFKEQYDTDSEFKGMVTSWPTLPPFLTDIVVDLGFEVTEKIVKKLVPGAEISADIVNVLRTFRGGSWMDLAKTVGELAWDTAKTINPSLKVYDTAKEAFSLFKKFKPLIAPLTEIYNKVDAATFGRIYSAMSNITSRNVLNKFQLLDELGYKNLKFFGSAKDLLYSIANNYGSAVYNIDAVTLGFHAGNIYFMFYPESTSTGTATLHISLNNFGPPKGSGTTIIKIRH